MIMIFYYSIFQITTNPYCDALNSYFMLRVKIILICYLILLTKMEIIVILIIHYLTNMFLFLQTQSRIAQSGILRSISFHFIAQIFLLICAILVQRLF